MTVSSQSGPRSPRPPEDLFTTATSALRRLHFKTGRGATKNTSKSQIVLALKDENWKEIKNRKNIINEAEKSYKNLYNTQINRPPTRTNTKVIIVESEDIPDITKEEILFALKTMKNNKAPESDKILTEMIKEAPGKPL
ncbi:hypothetical protein ILUMI_08075 [Ignelater luminosus]|uniref:2B protein soluble domain-containing protein n=1 Tax=Ignelater luminosus TaxID=2038154 RepID=A0A8K0D298_IGNLU|nr:hypothetical protein ILUMI_08075 [Ignelater luminosus]